MTVNDIISSVVEYLSSSPDDIEISTSEALKNSCGFAFNPTGEFLVAELPVDFDGMFELDHLIRNAVIKAGMSIDDSKFAEMKTGLPFHIPYIVKKRGFFAEYIDEPNPEHWRGFPELMWELGFEMDCYKSAPMVEEMTAREQTQKNIQNRLLENMAHWNAQQVGNYIFSRYRELTHWSDYGYSPERAGYFFERAFPILNKKLGEEWEDRHTEPEFNEFIKLVTSRLSQDVTGLYEFALSDEGLFHLKTKYNELIEKLETGEIKIPVLRERCIAETISYLKECF